MIFWNSLNKKKQIKDTEWTRLFERKSELRKLLRGQLDSTEYQKRDSAQHNDRDYEWIQAESGGGDEEAVGGQLPPGVRSILERGCRFRQSALYSSLRPRKVYPRFFFK